MHILMSAIDVPQYDYHARLSIYGNHVLMDLSYHITPLKVIVFTFQFLAVRRCLADIFCSVGLFLEIPVMLRTLIRLLCNMDYQTQVR